MESSLANAFVDELEKIAALRVGEARMLVGGILGATIGAGTSAAAGKEETRKRRAAIGAVSGAALGAGGGGLYHRLRPIIGRMRSSSQALDNVQSMYHTLAGKRAKPVYWWDDAAQAHLLKAPHHVPKHKSRPAFKSPSVTVWGGTGRDRNKLVAKVLPKTFDTGGRVAPVFVWQTNTRANPQEFASQARAYAKKHHTNTPGGRREF
jgi:hypothetical protein